MISNLIKECPWQIQEKLIGLFMKKYEKCENNQSYIIKNDYLIEEFENIFSYLQNNSKYSEFWKIMYTQLENYYMLQIKYNSVIKEYGKLEDEYEKLITQLEHSNLY
jgi:hypothetical protein